MRKLSPHDDFNLEICPPVELNSERNLFFNFIIFSDGVSFKNSTLKKALWPVCVHIADLPPKMRMSRQNFVLAALFKGFTHPN